MFNGLKRVSKEEKGFTLIELLAVIIIIGIIAAIAVPSIGGLINKTKDDADKATAQQLYEAARLYLTAEKNGDFSNATVTLTDLEGKYLPTNIKDGNGKEITAATVTFDKDGTLESVSFTTSDGTKNFDKDFNKPAGSSTSGT
ncbi:type II secretion system protein [Thermicanus aegyptius]|uniref:type II secretion system protein n=1 Tax=Thermicanus aegyptius TaxID=94009 RepID=UPI000429FFB8|nr:prepilin-type N-terminal cleavage/methylation domain-containing protein [Thermicanus aegyptius]